MTRAKFWASASAQIDRLEIRWPEPSGKVENFTNLPIDRYITIVEGQGINVKFSTAAPRWSARAVARLLPASS